MKTLCAALLVGLQWARGAQAFSFSYDPPTQCDKFSVYWTGALTLRSNFCTFNRPEHLNRRQASSYINHRTGAPYLNPSSLSTRLNPMHVFQLMQAALNFTGLA